MNPRQSPQKKQIRKFVTAVLAESFENDLLVVMTVHAIIKDTWVSLFWMVDPIIPSASFHFYLSEACAVKVTEDDADS